MKYLTQVFILTTFFSFLALPAYSQTHYRGFQVGLRGADQAVADQLGDFWGVNIARVQVEDNDNQDSVSNMDEYWDMLFPLLDRFDEVVSLLCPKNIKVILSLYSTPGGFHDRGGEGLTPQHEVFSSAWAQEGLKDAWAYISDRYSGNSCIHALDLMNEPAQREVAPGLKSWTELSAELVEIVRQNYSGSIHVKPVYGNPALLKHLPSFNDPKVLYSVHAYPDIEYAHAGLSEGDPIVQAPRDKRIVRRFLIPIARYYLNEEQKFNKGQIQHMPRFSIGEFGVLRSAHGAADYLDRLIALIEGDRNRHKHAPALIKREPGKRLTKAQRRENRRRRQLRRCLRHTLGFEEWINHAYAESNVWSPIHSNDLSDMEPVLPPVLTDRGEVLKRFFDRN